MHISGSTVLRELRRAGCAPSPDDYTVIGIDDGALARSHRNGTMVVDLERRRPIELLAKRDGATVKAWLSTQPHIEIMARDRGGAYAEAVRTVMPDALQVADRWHLLANLRDAVERLLMRCTSELREAAQQQASEVSPVEATLPTVVPAEPSLTAAQRHSKARRQHRLKRYKEVVRRRGNDESIRAIGLAMNIDRRTVRGFVRAGSFPERARRGSRASLLDAHRAYLNARIFAGCRNAMQVWRELHARGSPAGAALCALHSPSFRWLAATYDSTFIERQRRRHVVRAPRCWGGRDASSRRLNTLTTIASRRPFAPSSLRSRSRVNWRCVCSV
jgi:transposase